VGLVQFLGQRLKQCLGFEGGISVAGLSHLPFDRAAYLLGQVAANVPQLMDLALSDHWVVEQCHATVTTTLLTE
jgi:hypothetical protein